MDTKSARETMRAVVWEGKPFEMATRDVPKPRIQMPEDAIIRVTSAAICGTDLHTYHGVLGSRQVPWIQGHEAIGVVVEVGSATETFKIGDRVIILCFPDSGHFVTEPTLLSIYAGYGLGKDFGNLGGCQAEYVRVPFADDSLVVSRVCHYPLRPPSLTISMDTYIVRMIISANGNTRESPMSRRTTWTIYSCLTCL